MSLRAAVIGCGKIGSELADDPRVKGIYSHAGAYAASRRAHLAAVCDSDSARADRCARRWGLKTSYTNVEQLLWEVRPELVSICTPDVTHAAILREVLASAQVRGVLAEKPLALSAREAEDLVATAIARGIRLAVNYIRRHAPTHQRVRAALTDGAIGSVRFVSGLYAGGLVHNGTHWLDLVRWLIADVVAVQGFASSGESAGHADPSFDVRLEFAGGASGFLHGCPHEAFSLFEVDILGTAGRIRCVDSGNKIETYTVGDSPHYSGYRTLLQSSEMQGGLPDALARAVEDLIDCVEFGREPACSGADGVAALRIAEAARASIQTGRVARLEAGRS